MDDNMNEEELKDALVQSVQELSALMALYVKTTKLDAYECSVEFFYAEGQARLRLTDARYRKDKDGKLVRLPSGKGPDASSLDDAEARRRGEKAYPEAVPEPSKTPEQVVAELMKKLRLK